tara:strand:- start:82 stop:1410 length:1329 start_codon:yes stop_codon:yes gene_type:complete
VNLINKYQKLNKKLFDNSIAFISTFFGQIGIQIIYPPLMILTWGVENFGIIIYLIAIPSTLSFLIANFTTSARQEMAKAHLQNKLKEVNKIYSNTTFLVFISYLLFIFSSMVFLSYFSSDHLENYITTQDFNNIIALLILSFSLGFFNDIYSLKISYMGIYHISKYLDIIFDIATKVSMIIIGFVINDIIYIFIFYLAINVLKTLCFYYYNINVKKISFNIKRINILDIKDNINKAIPYYFIQLEEIFKTSFVTIIISTFFDFKTVALVTTIRTMFYFFPRKFFELIIELLQYEYVKLLMTKNFKKLTKLYKKQNLLILILSLIFVIFSHFVGLKIFNIWTNNSFQIENKIFYFLIFDCFFFLMTSSIISFLKSINNFFSFSLFLIISQILLITTLYGLYNNSYDYGTFFALSLTVSFLVFCISVIYYQNSLSQMKITKTFL